MSHKEMLKFDKTFLKKHKFHTIKKPNDINDFDIDHILNGTNTLFINFFLSISLAIKTVLIMI